MISPKKIKIFAIDDERDILYALRAVGDAMGWDVYTETNSLNAWRQYKAINPDLILVDYHMPQQDGLITVKQLRRLDRQIPIIVLTVDDNQAVADRFLDAGASDFANKPIKVPDLAARIKIHIRLLQKQRELGAGCKVTKGINEYTLQLIYDYCRTHDGWFTIEEVADQVGLAYQTTVRYLRYLQTQKELVVVSDYGEVGRPRNKYKMAN
mgnify:CR=1 FL=1